MLAIGGPSCFADWCEPLPDWLRLVVLAAAIAILAGTMAWAVITIRRRRR